MKTCRKKIEKESIRYVVTESATNERVFKKRKQESTNVANKNGYPEYTNTNAVADL